MKVAHLSSKWKPVIPRMGNRKEKALRKQKALEKKQCMGAMGTQGQNAQPVNHPGGGAWSNAQPCGGSGG